MKKNAILNDEEQRRIFSRNLNKYIRKSGKQQKEVAKDLGFEPTTFNTWCVGKAMPKMGKVQALADYFGILKSDLIDDKNGLDFDLPEKDLAFLKRFNSLDDQGRSTVRYIMDRESERVKKIEELTSRISELEAMEEHPTTIIEMPPKETEYPMRLIGYYRSASAGSGIFILGNEDVEALEIPDTPENRVIDFAIKVGGDSMEPDFHDNDIALVSKRSEISYGDVGIFIVDGNSYIKEYGKTELISRNPESPNIKISEYSNIVCMGKVIGKL